MQLTFFIIINWSSFGMIFVIIRQISHDQHTLVAKK